MIRNGLIAACILIPLVTAVHAQPPGRGGFGSFFGGRGRLLVDWERVRKELGVDDEQAALLDALQRDLAEQRRAIREEDEGPRSADETVQQARFAHLLEKLATFDRHSESLVALVLEPEQATRLSELYLQRDGIRAFERPEVATKLQLSDEQKTRLQSLRETFVESRSRRTTSEQRQELREKEQEALRQLLTEEQRTLWDQLLGKPFDFSTITRRGLPTR